MSHRDERGSITVWLALSSFVMIFLVGLAVDLGGQVHALAFLIELVDLNGRQKLNGEHLHTVLKY